MPLTVLADTTPLSDDSRFRGIGTYVRELTARLAQLPDVDVLGLTRDPGDLPAGLRPVRVRRGLVPGRWRGREHELLLPFDLTRAARSAPVDVVMSLAQTPPWRSPRPFSQTLHDVIPLIDPDPHYAEERRRWLRIAGRARRADAILAVSAHTAGEATRLLELDAARVHVVPLGVSPRFSPGAGGPAPAQPDDLAYLLHVAEYDPRKRSELAVEVADRVAEAGLPHRLRWVGRVAPWYADRVQAVVAGARHPDRLDVVGRVDDEALVELYRGAALVLITSRAEGFGLPALEAMACGAPVLAFANSATAEVVGDGGVLVADGDVEAYAAAALDLLRSPARRAELAEAGPRRAAGYSWDRCAADTADVLRSVAR
jgi:alpha-1,3-rhamnosyl/mannosyltransferase